MIHIFAMINAGRQLIEELHNAFLSESEIFSSPCIVIISALESHLESTSVESMSYFSDCTKLESIALSYGVEARRTCESAESSIHSSLTVFLGEQITNLRESEFFFIFCE